MPHQPVSHEMWFARFETYLHQQGYRPSTIKRHRAVCRQFLQYLHEQQIPLEQVDPAILEAYFHHQTQHYQQRHGRAPRDASHLFNRGIPVLLRLVHGHWPPPTPPTTARERFQQQVCADYAHWLAQCRGLTPRTIAVRRASGQQFLAWFGEQGTPEQARNCWPLA